MAPDVAGNYRDRPFGFLRSDTQVEATEERNVARDPLATLLIHRPVQPTPLLGDDNDPHPRKALLRDPERDQ